MAVPLSNLLGRDLYIDTHIVDAADERAVDLRRLNDEGWLRVIVTDVVDTELMSATPHQKRDQLLSASAEFIEAHGPAVPGVSRHGASVHQGEPDAERLDAVYTILFPGADRKTATSNHLRDAMHVSTAIRYGGYAFVTRERRLLNKSEAITGRFLAFRIWSVDQALRDTATGIHARRMLHRLEPWRGALPDWPTDDLLAEWLAED